MTTFTCDTCDWASPIQQIQRDAYGNPVCPVCVMPPEERAEMEQQVEMARLRAGIGTPDELADYEAARRMIQSGE